MPAKSVPACDGFYGLIVAVTAPDVLAVIVGSGHDGCAAAAAIAAIVEVAA